MLKGCGDEVEEVEAVMMGSAGERGGSIVCC